MRIETLFDILDNPAQFVMFEHQAAQADKGAHYEDVDLYGAIAVENTGKHGNPIIGESIRYFPDTTPT